VIVGLSSNDTEPLTPKTSSSLLLRRPSSTPELSDDRNEKLVETLVTSRKIGMSRYRSRTRLSSICSTLVAAIASL
jgi:hypothetical protein